MYEHKAPMSTCIFEHIYFARPDATIDGLNAYSFRAKTEILAKESPVDADVIVPVPDSGWPGAAVFHGPGSLDHAALWRERFARFLMATFAFSRSSALK